MTSRKAKASQKTKATRTPKQIKISPPLVFASYEDFLLKCLPNEDSGRGHRVAARELGKQWATEAMKRIKESVATGNVPPPVEYRPVGESETSVVDLLHAQPTSANAASNRPRSRSAKH